MDMAKVYSRLIIDTALPNEDYVSGIIRVYNNPICEVIDNYNNRAFYEPSYMKTRAYKEGEFWYGLRIIETSQISLNNLVTHGCAKYVERPGKHENPNGLCYGSSIVSMMKTLLKS